MVIKTFEDCEACLVYGICSSHFADGEWEHDEGVDPCVVIENKTGWEVV